MKFISCSNKKSIFLAFIVILSIIVTSIPLKDFRYKSIEYKGIVEDKNSKLSNTGDNIFRLIYGTLDGPADLDPHNAWDRLSFEVIDQVCEGLYGYNTSDPGLSLIPILAESIGTFSPDMKNFTVNLRQGVKFHDGSPFNATAVKWSFDRLAYLINNNKSKLAELYQYYNSTLKTYVPIIKETNVISDYVVSFILNEPYGYIPDILTIPSSYI
ncbi:MAG: ABC transporter substrate-binding protein, partial [Promethearchaeota archaeon]